MLLSLSRLENGLLLRRGSNTSINSIGNPRTHRTYACNLFFRLPQVVNPRKHEAQCRCTSSHASQTKDEIAEPESGLLRARSNGLECGEETKRSSSSIDTASEFYFDAGYALFAKRPSKPFPPPFASGASEMGTDAWSKQSHRSIRRDWRDDGVREDKGSQGEAKSKLSAGSDTEGGAKLTDNLQREIEMIRGITNGDDAVLAGQRFIGANDGVGAWATKENGHAA